MGATGGGYILSKGVVTKASMVNDGDKGMNIVVDGDKDYQARTTRRAIGLLLDRHGPLDSSLLVEQWMGVPVGCGFGASAASAISAIYAVAGALGLRLAKKDLAYFAHVADIVEQTGLGTVSVAYDAKGAGAITKAGGPGVSEFLNVKVPKGIKIVTASLAPISKSMALSDPATTAKIRKFGAESLKKVISIPTLEELGKQGERFGDLLGLMSSDDEALVRTAKQAGAEFASQNMIGHAIHSVVRKENVQRVAAALSAAPSRPRVDVFDVGSVRAGIGAAPH